MADLLILAPLSSLVALGFAVYLVTTILKVDEGTD